MNIILLSGGSGKRLWPLSNDARSKQFLKVFSTENGTRESMVQRMYRMIKEVNSESNITIATSQNQVESIKRQLCENVDISIEPCRRDTFPAIALATAFLHDVKGISKENRVVICPVDPFVDSEYFQVLEEMEKSQSNANLLLMGIKPSYPSEKYGYIIFDEDGKVSAFKEKPTCILAEEYIKNGALWNGGVFAFRIGYMLEKIYELIGTESYYDILERYEELPKISFDYAIAEKEQLIDVITYGGQWKDLGTWNTLTEAMNDNTSGNVIIDDKCQNTHIINELNMPLIVLGVKNAAIVATSDGILVSDKEQSSYLKEYVPEQRPMTEKRQWGEYRVLDYQNEGDIVCLTKELIVNKGCHLSYQKHTKRSESWTLSSGEGTLVIDGVLKNVKRGDSVFIPANTLHSIRAKSELHIIEVQIGDELIEEDIERYEYNWEQSN